MPRPCPPSLINCCSANPDLLTCPNLPMRGQPFAADSCCSPLMSPLSLSHVRSPGYVMEDGTPGSKGVNSGRWHPGKRHPPMQGCRGCFPDQQLPPCPRSHCSHRPPTSCFPSFFLPLTCCRLDYFSPDAAICIFPRLNLPGFVLLISLSPFLCYFCPCQCVAHPPQIILMHHLLDMALMTTLRVSVGAAPLPGYLG